MVQIRQFVPEGVVEVTAISRISESASLEQAFRSARWVFHDDGRCLFVTAPGDLADDLSPLAGRWSGNDALRVVQLERASIRGVSVSLMGRIRRDRDGRRFTGQYESYWRERARIHAVTVGLTDDPAVLVTAGIRTLAGMPIPAAFIGVTEGVCGSQPFGPLEIEFSLTDAGGGSPHPIGFVLSPTDHLAFGGLLWLAGTADLTANDPGQTYITVTDGHIEASMSATGTSTMAVTFSVPARAGFGYAPAPAWINELAASEPPPGMDRLPDLDGLGLASIPVPAIEARLSLRVKPGDRPDTLYLSGRVAARGHLPAQSVDYQATVTATARLPTVSGFDAEEFDRQWRLAAVDRNLGPPSAPSVAPAVLAPRTDPARAPAAGPARTWRDIRDAGFREARAGRLSPAIQLLTKALAGCRAEEDDPGLSAYSRYHALISESTILGVLLSCQDDRSDREVVLDLLVRGVEVTRLLEESPNTGADTRASLRQAVGALGDVLERWRQVLTTEIERVDLLEAFGPYFNTLVGFLAGFGRADTALVASENARARAFADLLSARHSGMHPDRARHGASQVPPAAPALTAPAIRAAVAGYGAVVVEYWISEAGCFAWIVTPAGQIAKVRLATSQRQLVDRLELLRAAMKPARDADPARRWARQRALLGEMYEVLIRPLPAALLPADGEVLAIVPHRALFNMPWAALLDDSEAYLIEQYALVMLPSIGTLTVTGLDRLGPPAAPRGLLALVNPTMPAPSPGTDRLPALPRVERDLPAFTALFPAQNVRRFTGDSATLCALADAGRGYDVVLLGTHGHGNEEDPDASYLAFAPDEGRHTGLATIAEIADLRLSCQLAVLLACESGRGRITGDGVLGISRAFLLAGATSLLSTLWLAPAQITPALIYWMMDAWVRGGAGRAEALRRAQIDYAERYRDQPWLWSGFQLTGAWR